MSALVVFLVIAYLAIIYFQSGHWLYRKERRHRAKLREEMRKERANGHGQRSQRHHDKTGGAE